MKAPRYNKVIGLSLGDRSLLAAEVSAGEKTAVKRAAEFVYPEGTSLSEPAVLGKALGEFLRSNQFSGKSAVVGLPAKWLAVKPKDVPPADAATLAEILRLQAEGEFSTDLKDLIYDYAGVAPSVMLIATQRKYVDGATAMCEAAGLTAIAVTPTAVALGSATSRSVAANAMVLAVSPSGAEFTAQHGPSPVSVKPLRSASTGEVRRAVSGVPANDSPRELVLWDSTGIDPVALGGGLGFALRMGELSSLGVDASAAGTANNRKFAPAVAVALEAIGDRSLAIDFLHSRLAEPKKPLLPRWAVYAAGILLLLIVGLVWMYVDVQKQTTQLAADKAKLDSMKDQITAAETFVSKVTFAQAWHSSDPRYLKCVRDLTESVPPDDDQTYATSLLIREGTTSVKGKTVPTGLLAGTVAGKTSNQDHVQKIRERLESNPAFSAVMIGGAQDAGRGREVSFSITFNYKPGKG